MGCKTKQKKQQQQHLWSRNFFIQKATKKNLFIKAWDSRTHQNKKRPDRPSPPPPPYKPRFYSYVPFDDSVFLIRTTKKQQKKKFLFSVLFILKKREKNLKEKKS